MQDGAETSEAGSTSAWNFARHTLEEAIKVPQALEEKNAGKPVLASELAKWVGFRKSNDWRFLNLLRSANAYGLVTGSGAAATVEMAKIGNDLVAPSSADQRQKALLAAFNNVDLFKRVVTYYENKRIPEDEYFGNTLVREFKIQRDRVETFIAVFNKNLEFLKAFAVDREGKPIVKTIVAPGDVSAKVELSVPATEQSDAIREFLDDCFVMMPFGSWFDRYYKDVYFPAIKDAGYEPVRADDLFQTGSVMEQIWDQIRKAKVLLAELTGKNPNVFYELGLAHALGKPVVFVTGSIDDVPFDLRHLRVITYEVREPEWSTKLRKNITAYLKNTRLDPTKSIPQPFRDNAPKASTDDPDELGNEDEATTKRK
ncbi:MAG: hypothetical protein ACKVS9_01820 [Phycisphaerae bacterium]